MKLAHALLLLIAETFQARPDLHYVYVYDDEGWFWEPGNAEAHAKTKVDVLSRQDVRDLIDGKVLQPQKDLVALSLDEAKAEVETMRKDQLTEAYVLLKAEEPPKGTKVSDLKAAVVAALEELKATPADPAKSASVPPDSATPTEAQTNPAAAVGEPNTPKQEA